MKKVFFASAAILMTFISANAQTDNLIAKNDTKPNKEERKEIKKEKKEERTALKMQSNEVSYQSKQEFYRNFGDHPEATWRNSKTFDEATFDNNGVKTIAYYDFEGQLVGTTCTKRFEDLPADAQKQLRKEYKDYTVNTVVFFDDNEANDTNMVLYNNSFDDEDNYFVELQKDNKTIVVQVTMDGQVGYFTELK